MRETDAAAMVRRSRVAPRVTCRLCGGFLRDAAVISDSEECIVGEFTHNNVNHCPKCKVDLGCKPLEKLRADRSLQHIRSVIFPAKRRKVDEISPLHPAFVLLPSPSNRAHRVDHSAKEAYAHLMGEVRNGEIETEADVSLGTEPSSSLEKFIVSSPHTALAPGAGPAWPVLSDDRENRDRDEQMEDESSAPSETEWSAGELCGAIEGSGIEVGEVENFLSSWIMEFKSEHHGLLDKQSTASEMNTLTEEMDTLVIPVPKRKTKMAIVSTVFTAVEVTAEGRAAPLPAVALQSEAQENSARMSERVVTCIGISQAVEAESTRPREKIDNEREEMAHALERIRVIEERLDAHISQSKAREAEHAKLEEELRNERAANAIAFERIKVLEKEVKELRNTLLGGCVGSSHPYGQQGSASFPLASQSEAQELELEERKVGYRCSPNKLPKIFDSLSKDQRGYIEKIGFGNILSIAECMLPKALTLWLVDRVDVDEGTLDVDGQSISIKAKVKDVIGAPCGKFQVLLSKSVDDSKFTKDGKGMPLKAAVTKMEKEKNESEFIEWFMLVALGYYLAPSTNLCINRNFLPNLQDVTKISQMDWCDFIGNYLLEGIKEYRASTSKHVQVKGCLHILNVIYLDCKPNLSIEVPKGKPRLQHVTTAHLRMLEAEVQSFWGAAKED